MAAGGVSMQTVLSGTARGSRPVEVQLYAPHAGQWKIHRALEKYRFVVADCGRRMGKTLAGDNEEVKHACQKPYSLNWWVAPTRRQAEGPFEQASRALHGLLRKKPNETKLQLDLINGSRIEYRSGDDPENLRGDGPDFLVIDECRKLKRRAWDEVLRPSIADRQAQVLFISTPNGRDWFWELFERGKDKMHPEWYAIKLPSTANPFLPAWEVEEARRTLPARVFEQEFLAEFVDDAGVFRGIDACIAETLSAPLAERAYVLGWDIAKHEDFSVMTVMDALTGRVVAWDRYNGTEYTVQLARLYYLAHMYNDAVIIMDSTGVGDPLFDMVRALGLTVQGYYFTNASKKELIDGLALAIEHKQIRYPNIPELIGELRAFSYKITEARNVVYSAPEGLHDDCVFSLALAVHGLHAGGGVIPIIGRSGALAQQPDGLPLIVPAENDFLEMRQAVTARVLSSVLSGRAFLPPGAQVVESDTLENGEIGIV